MGGPHVILRVLIIEAEEAWTTDSGNLMEAKLGAIQGKSHEPRNTGSLWRLERAGELILPRDPQEEPALPTP